MWIFLSRRLRTWLLLTVALPLARMVIRARAATGRRDPDRPAESWLQRADSPLTRRTRRRR